MKMLNKNKVFSQNQRHNDAQKRTQIQTMTTPGYMALASWTAVVMTQLFPGAWQIKGKSGRIKPESPSTCPATRNHLRHPMVPRFKPMVLFGNQCQHSGKINMTSRDHPKPQKMPMFSPKSRLFSTRFFVEKPPKMTASFKSGNCNILLFFKKNVLDIQAVFRNNGSRSSQSSAKGT